MKKGAAPRAKTRAEAKAAPAAEDPKLAGLRAYGDVLKDLRDAGGAPATEMRNKLTGMVRTEWARIEQELLPKGKKY